MKYFFINSYHFGHWFCSEPVREARYKLEAQGFEVFKNKKDALLACIKKHKNLMDWHLRDIEDLKKQIRRLK